ncbi:hypothetical protein AC579_6440 [Pseudocercospora musae]|uniref:Uncharacterized protein n=1 Tax=Pseudocercospora musae TaxID=113226 RepID=A0A139I219_9PEZI|nr:hypothetical protein AC579_6440 [Pseudocercospora musae]
MEARPLTVQASDRLWQSGSSAASPNRRECLRKELKDTVRGNACGPQGESDSCMIQGPGARESLFSYGQQLPASRQFLGMPNYREVGQGQSERSEMKRSRPPDGKACCTFTKYSARRPLRETLVNVDSRKSVAQDVQAQQHATAA